MDVASHGPCEAAFARGDDIVIEHVLEGSGRRCVAEINVVKRSVAGAYNREAPTADAGMPHSWTRAKASARGRRIAQEKYAGVDTDNTDTQRGPNSL